MVESAHYMDKETRKSLIQIANISSMGIALGVTIFGCFFIGYYLDQKLGTGHFFTFFLLILGIVAGFKNVYTLIKKSVSNEKPLDKKDESGREKASSEKD